MGAFRPSSLRATHVSGEAAKHAHADADGQLTNVGEALELVQAALEEARR